MSLSWEYLQATDEHSGKHHSVTPVALDAALPDNAAVEHVLKQIEQIKHAFEDVMAEREVDACELRAGIERLLNCEETICNSTSTPGCHIISSTR